MAFMFYKKSSEKERIRSLCYPYRPLLEDYFSGKFIQTEFATYMNCYKWFSKSRRFLDWKRALLRKNSRYNFETIFNEVNLNFSAKILFDLLCDIDSSDMKVIVAILAMYVASKTGGMNSPYLKNRSVSARSFSSRQIQAKEVKKYDFIVPVSIESANVRLLRLLLRYGFERLPASVEKHHVLDTIKNLR